MRVYCVRQSNVELEYYFMWPFKNRNFQAISKDCNKRTRWVFLFLLTETEAEGSGRIRIIVDNKTREMILCGPSQ